MRKLALSRFYPLQRRPSCLHSSVRCSVNSAASRPRRSSPTGLMRTQALYDEAARDRLAFWAEQARTLTWTHPWQSVLEWTAPHARWFSGGQLNVAANCVDRHLSGARRNKAAIIWEGEPGDRRVLHLLGAGPGGRPVRQRAQGARRAEGRPRRDLPADDPRGRDRDARLRAHRRRALRGVRRLLGRGAARPHQRLRVHGPHHRRRRLPPRQRASAQALRRRGPRATVPPSGTWSWCAGGREARATRRSPP